MAQRFALRFVSAPAATLPRILNQLLSKSRVTTVKRDWTRAIWTFDNDRSPAAAPITDLPKKNLRLDRAMPAIIHRSPSRLELERRRRDADGCVVYEVW
jgi:hypothetical protein